MNRLPKLVITALSIVALAAPVHPFAAAQDDQGRHAAKAAPIVERQMKSLTESLDLTRDQQARIVPVLEEMHEATLKIAQDPSLSHDERMARVRPVRLKADQQIRQVLNDEQQKKLDQFEREPHPEMHADLN